jgi:hypothetical protein
MEYIWNIYGIYMEYIWNIYMEYIWNIYGIYIYGIYMDLEYKGLKNITGWWFQTMEWIIFHIWDVI